jgi:ABC-type branched-subunit amino acid transport system ATPase component
MSQDGPSLVAQDLWLGYGDVPVIQGVSVEASARQITVLVGPNGSGKSTLLKGIAGLLIPSSGSIHFEGNDVRGVKGQVLIRRGLGFVPQQGAVFPGLTVAENLDMGAYTLRKRRKQNRDFVCELFPVLQVCLTRAAWTLSGGEQRMLAIARALMAEPRVLLLDEPTVGLSPVNQNVVWNHVLQLRDRGLAVLVVEQNTRQALGHGDRAYVLAFGRVQLQGTGDELLAHPDLSKLYLSDAASDRP